MILTVPFYTPKNKQRREELFSVLNFLILYSKIKRKNNFLNKFYSICPKPNFCFYLKTKKDKILNTHKYRKRKNIQMWLEIDQIRNFVNFEKKNTQLI